MNKWQEFVKVRMNRSINKNSCPYLCLECVCVLELCLNPLLSAVPPGILYLLPQLHLLIILSWKNEKECMPGDSKQEIWN